MKFILEEGRRLRIGRTKNSWQSHRGYIQGKIHVRPLSIRLGLHDHLPPCILDISKKQKKRISEERTCITASHAHDPSLIMVILLFMIRKKVQAETSLTLANGQKENYGLEMFICLMATLYST